MQAELAAVARELMTVVEPGFDHLTLRASCSGGGYSLRLTVLPKNLPPDADPITRIFFDYYRTDRGYHPRSINSTTAWTGTTPMSFFAFPLMTNIDMLAPRKALLVAGADAHSRYYSEDVQAKAPGTVDLVIVPGADHVDLYDRKDLIPFDRLDEFFIENLD
jgi:fermentation-respiration switch protein FrsA (DUF1100 family)